MKKLLIGTALVIGFASPANAWYDGYGNYHCTYLDPLTSVMDSIFGQPCYAAPPPQPVVVQAPPVVIEQPVPYPVPEPYPVYVDRPVPVPQPYAVPYPVPAPYPVPLY